MTISRQRLNINSVLGLKAKVFSFDVFDTILTRMTATPVGIFRLIQNKVQQQIAYNIPVQLIHDFCYLRVQAEQEAKENTKKEAVTITEIYETLKRKFRLSDQICDFLINLEIEQELDAVYPVPKAIQILNTLRKQKARIVFISDMYLPKQIIRKLLEKFGAYKEGDGLYVSNNFALSKKSGKLFEHVLKAEDCLPFEMIHFGDSRKGDIEAARRIGIKVIHFRDTQLNRYEKVLLGNEEKKTNFSEDFANLVAGASRLARLNSNNGTDLHYALHCLGANLAGPILVGYIIWILQEARRCNLSRLYFFARDGQILLEIARKIAKTLKLNIDLRYLYVSRQALFFSASTELGNREIEWLLAQERPLTLQTVAYRARIQAEVLQKALQRCTGKRLEKDQVLRPEEVESLHLSFSDTQLSSLILTRAEEMRKTALSYFKQEGLMDKVSWGIVDLGWQGRTQDALKKILDSIGHTERTIYGLYFGLCPTKFEYPNKNVKKAFLFDSDSPKQLLNIMHRSTRIMEIFTTGDHGLTLSYYQDSHGICRPELKEPRNENALNWGLEYLRKGIYSFLNYLTQAEPKNLSNSINYYRKLTVCLMKLLLLNPSREEAEAIGRYLFYYTGLREVDARVFAPSFSIPTALRYGFNFKYHKNRYLTCWFEGTRSRSNVISQLILSYKGRAVLSRVGAVTRNIAKKI